MIAFNILWVVGAVESVATSTTSMPKIDENITFTPNVDLYQDRLPGSNGSIELPIGTSSEFINFVKMAHTGWNHYQIVVRHVAFDEYNVVIRWALNATVGPHDKMIIPINKPEGTHVTYNGTDWLYLDDCTGRIK
ncbi:hypothetical protein V8C34DRAFT_324100 [Trichoderma compactum]